jgi:rhodanese-related sulfurtransferase
MRAALVAALGLSLVALATSPAGAPDYPVNFITVEQLKAELDRGTRADLIDVRNWSAYVKQHIKGARSMPLKSVPDRAREIARTGLVVFY